MNGTLINPANKAEVEGVTFIKFLWEEQKAGLENLTQSDIETIWKCVYPHTPEAQAKKSQSKRDQSD